MGVIALVLLWILVSAVLAALFSAAKQGRKAARHRDTVEDDRTRSPGL